VTVLVSFEERSFGLGAGGNRKTKGHDYRAIDPVYGDLAAYDRAMCDSLVVVRGDAVWFAKNSDREPGESQAVEHRLRERHGRGTRVRATYLDIDQATETNEVVLSRPTWMWGAEMGANEHGLAIGNEAVFTRVAIGADYTRLGSGTIEGARSLGLLRRGETFDFRRCFGRPVMGWLTGGTRGARVRCGARKGWRGSPTCAR